MRALTILIVLGLQSTAFARPPAKYTKLIACRSYKLVTTGELPKFAYGDPLKSKPSPNEQWSIIDGHFENAGAVKFEDEKGKLHDVKMRREMAYQYGEYIIQKDVIQIPSFQPCPGVCSESTMTISRDSKEGTAIDLFPIDSPDCHFITEF